MVIIGFELISNTFLLTNNLQKKKNLRVCYREKITFLSYKTLKFFFSQFIVIITNNSNMIKPL